jgi:uncharacterized protein (TIGR03000 family)
MFKQGISPSGTAALAAALLLSAAGPGLAQHRGGGGGGHGGAVAGGHGAAGRPAGGGARGGAATARGFGHVNGGRVPVHANRANVRVFAGGRFLPFAALYYPGLYGYGGYGSGYYSPSYGGYYPYGDYNGYAAGYYSPAYNNGSYAFPDSSIYGAGPLQMPYAPGALMPNADAFVPPTNLLPSSPEGSVEITPSVSSAEAPVTIQVRLPEDAEMWVDGKKMAEKGSSRRFQSPPLAPGQDYVYELRVRWKEDGRTMDYTRNITVRAGDKLNLNLLSARPE